MVIKKCRQEKEKDKSCDLFSLVGHHIEISNRFIRDYVAVFQIAKQCKTSLATSPPFQRRVWVDCRYEPFEADPRKRKQEKHCCFSCCSRTPHRNF